VSSNEAGIAASAKCLGHRCPEQPQEIFPVIDLHCHMLPGIDDGARDLPTALAMASIAVGDGITVAACTPHIYPGLFDNDANGIESAVAALRVALQEADIALELTFGADIQMVPELLRGLQEGTHPTLHRSRYFLFEPPHHIVPMRFHESIFDVIAAGYVPVITHPERLTWLDEEHYPWFEQAARGGAWMQVTAGAITGRFGREARYWAERMLDDGIVHILATDAHDSQHRPPLLGAGREAAVKWVGETEAERLVDGRPRAILADQDPSRIPPPPMLEPSAPARRQRKPNKGWLSRLFGHGK
jgi:protein-tyrosine phosphatase